MLLTPIVIQKITDPLIHLILTVSSSTFKTLFFPSPSRKWKDATWYLGSTNNLHLLKFSYIKLN